MKTAPWQRLPLQPIRPLAANHKFQCCRCCRCCHCCHCCCCQCTKSSCVPHTVLKRSLTRAAPSPMYISMNSLALLLMNATPLSPATARAISVLPFPAGTTEVAGYAGYSLSRIVLAVAPVIHDIGTTQTMAVLVCAPCLARGVQPCHCHDLVMQQAVHLGLCCIQSPTWGSHQQHTLGWPRARCPELLRLAEEVNHLHQLNLRDMQRAPTGWLQPT